MKKMLILLVIVSLAGILAGCRQKSASGTMLSESERKAVLRFSDPKTDNLMAGLSEGDYEVFSKDFDDSLRETMTESEFELLKKDLDDKLGRYYSREVEGVVRRGDGSYTVIYSATFDQAIGVLIRVTFRPGFSHKISQFSIEE